MEIKNETIEFPSKYKITCGIMFALGLITFFVSLKHSPERAWVNFLLNNFYFVSLALSGVFFVALATVAKASWLAPYKKIPMSMAKFLPFGLILMVALYFGIHTLYEWSHHAVMESDPLLKLKSAFLNTPGFMVRMFVIFSIWTIFSLIFYYLHDRQEVEGSSSSLQLSLMKASAVFLVLFGLSYSLASFDWIMSLEPHWFSTIYAVYTFAGLFVTGVSFITLMILTLKRMGYLEHTISNDHLHDLGKWMFGFSTFWAYIWVSQYLLIWYSNIPEETQYFVLRSHHGWSWPFWINVIMNWALPFFVLMKRSAKRNTYVLSRVAFCLLIGHWLDLYLLIAPKVYEHAHIANPGIGVTEVFMFAGYFGFFCLVVGKAMSGRKFLYEKDPYLKEGLCLHQ